MEGGRWALILGVSSGFGAATARRLAAAGYGIAGIHLDRRATMPAVEALRAELEALVPGRVRLFNRNAADDAARAEIVAELAPVIGPGGLGVLMHSLAFGSMAPLVVPGGQGSGGARAARRSQIEMTSDVMGHSLVWWAQAAVEAGLLGEGGRIFAMTSAGSHMVWPGYGPVSAAKALLEVYIRQLAVELAPLGITANAILAGTTRTPALEKIPGADMIIEQSIRRNPHGRLGTPDDVARCIVALCGPDTYWMTGNVIRVDGGEDIAG